MSHFQNDEQIGGTGACAIVKDHLLPPLFYLALFCLLTYPLIGSFSTNFWTDGGDGTQMIWNIWWVNKAVTQLHVHPWFTRYLHFPDGATLAGHTLHPFNGFLAILLLPFLSLIQTFNLLIIFSFVAGGVAAYYLARNLTGSRAGSLLAGCVFTFSSYHFAHAHGHMQLTALEWIPLFVLTWLKFLRSAAWPTALACAAALFLVLLCDHYYFAYCVLFAVIAYLFRAWENIDLFFLFRKKAFLGLAVFLGAAALTSGVFIAYLLIGHMRDPLIGSHDPNRNSMDLLAPFIPGGRWRFGQITKPYWSRLPGDINGSSLFLGYTVLFAILYAWKRARRKFAPELRLWFFVVAFFGVMALGPHLFVMGKKISFLPMPYRLLEWIFPPFRLGGVPDRMMVMVTLGAAVICAFAMREWRALPSPRKSLALLFFPILMIEYLPDPPGRLELPVPNYVYFLKNLPGNDALIDTTMSGSIAMFYQTIHEKPMAFGYISRTPTSVWRKENRLHEQIIRALDAGRYDVLRNQYGFRYITIDNTAEIAPPGSDVRKIYRDPTVTIYDINPSRPDPGPD